MDKFHTTVTAYEFPVFKDFAECFEICEEDVIVTHSFLAKDYMEPLDLKCSYLFYEDFCTGEPTEDAVDAMRDKINGMSVNRIIAVGGGSILDSSKMLCIKGAKCTLDIFEDKIPIERDKKLILVPTTCGTGSEMDGIAVIYINKYNTKMGKGSHGSFADASVLIPQLMEKLPFEIFMQCSLDALIHGIESYLSPLSHSFSNVFNAECVRLIVRNYRLMRDEGIDARKAHILDFARASAFSGIGLSHNPCGAIHACAMVFGGMHHTPHGMTNAIFMHNILKRYAQKEPNGTIKNLAKIINEELGIQEGAAGAFAALETLINGLITFDPLSKFGMDKANSRQYAEKVLATQQRLIVQSYVGLTVDELTEVFEELC